ncbi:A Designed Ankyrin Repeat Protein [Oopsacas minuta]|uniref:A Designed Ankyrin Repeat Protein n=1 Tax=Oopsacas minuta TaxID=111878 RepID=A0AAV7JAM3_9METZ|nr:A Designed Ankyrin Repeat Protein [Oopsacas minuta]
MLSRKSVKKRLPSFPIHAACLSGDLISIKDYISTRGNIDCRDRNGRTPLHETCCIKHFSNYIKSGTVLELVKLLIKNGADPMATDDLGETPLHCVARHRIHREIAAYFVTECMVSLTCLNKFGQTPLDVAKESSTSLLKSLSYRKNPPSANCDYISQLPEVLQFLLLHENLCDRSLRSLAREKINLYLYPYSHEKLNELPLPNHMKCYIGGLSFIQWMKKRETFVDDYNNNEDITQTSSCKLM